MFGKSQQALVEALAGGNWNEVARILCAPRQTLEHQGRVVLSGAVDRVDRGYHGDGTNKPVPPIKPPISDGARLEIPAGGAEDDDRAGEAGLGVDFARPARFSLLWALRWATVDSVGQTATGYDYSDGHECANAKGDRTTTVPIRVFHAAGAPATGAVVPYLRDYDGLPWAVGGGGEVGVRVTGYLVADLATVEETFTITGVEAIVGTSPVASAEETLLVYNTHHWTADAGALVRAEWHAAHEKWEAYQIDCPE